VNLKKLNLEEKRRMSKQSYNPLKLAPSFALLLLMGSLLVGCSVQPVMESQPTPASTETVAAPATPAPTVPTEIPTEVPAEASTEIPTEMPAETPVDAPATEPAPTAENIPSDGQGAIAETGSAVVEQLEVRILESDPVQVQAVLTGYLPDGCTNIVDTEVVSAGTTFRIRMTTKRPENAICTQAIVPFEEVVPIDVSGYPAGSYDVRVNDLIESFELP
jgi:hypothetical protein